MIKPNNKTWAEKVIIKYEPNFLHRWEIYNKELISLLNKDIIWIDCGCGNNEKVLEYGSLTKMAYGIDFIKKGENEQNFIKADIKHLPIKPSSIDLITLRFVVEHFKDPQDYFREYARVLKNNGKVLLITTNRFSPVIFIPKLLLPNKIKSFIITRVFNVDSVDIFKTYHNLNTLKKLKNIKNFKIRSFLYLSDLNLTRKWMFAILFSWHRITTPKFLNKFRTNILTLLEKSSI